MTAGNVTAPLVTVTACPARAPSIQSSAVPVGLASAESFTVADTVMGASNGDGDSGLTLTVVVVSSAVPSAYMPATSAPDSAAV